jgi:hypothetical protein
MNIFLALHNIAALNCQVLRLLQKRMHNYKYPLPDCQKNKKEKIYQNKTGKMCCIEEQ